MLARLTMQKACLEFAERELRDRPGVILELGLGKGRTYDHLRKLFPARDIHAFDKDVHAPADCVPDREHLWLGDFRQRLADARRAGLEVALVHADVGSEDRERDAELAAALGPLIDELLSTGAMVLTDREMRVERWQRLTLPNATADWDYFIYRVQASGHQ